MPKIHYCKKVFDSVICGETNPEKFHTGKYSICKDCNKKGIYELRKKEREVKEQEKIKEIDPDSKFKNIAENVILNTEIKDGFNIKDSLDILNNKCNILQTKYDDLLEQHKKLTIEYNESMKTNNEMMKTFIQMKTTFEEYKIFCRDIKRYVDENLSSKQDRFVPVGRLGQ
jgi:hypothetical protein